MKKLILIFMLLLYVGQVQSKEVWESTASPYYSTIYYFLFDAGGNIFITANNGLFRSTDKGASWERLKSKVEYSYVAYLAQDKKGSIYATSAGSSNGEPGNIYRSDDKGNTWQMLLDTLGNTVPRIVLFDKDDNLYISTSTRGVYMSSNSGDDWQTRNKGIDSAVVSSFTRDSSNNLFAGVYGKGYLYKTTDGGLSWFSSCNGIDTTSPVSIITLATAPSGKIFAGTAASKLYFSTDNGANWTNCSSGLDSAGEIYSILFDSSNSIWLGTRHGLYFSSDDGATWDYLDQTSHMKSVQRLAIDPEGTIYAGTSTGIFYSNDHLLNFSQLLSVVGKAGISSMVINKDDVILANGSSSTTIFRTADNGDTWQRLNPIAGTGQTSFNILAADKKGRFYANYNGRLYISSNEGLQWDTTGLNIAQAPPPAGGGTINAIAFKDNYRIAATTRGIYKNIDGDTAWIHIEREYTSNNNIKSLAVDSKGNIYSTHNSLFSAEVFKSSDNGDTWIQTENALGGVLLNAIIIDQDDNVFIASRDGGVFVSTNGGDSWEQRVDGLLTPWINTLVAGNHGEIYAGSGKGHVFVTYDKGLNWLSMSEGLEAEKINKLLLNNEGTLFAGTAEAGLFRTIIPISDYEDDKGPLPITVKPNPVSSTCNIEFALSVGSKVRIDIIDMLGNRIAALVDSYFSPGNYKFSWLAENISQGCYFLIFNSGNSKTVTNLIKIN